MENQNDKNDEKDEISKLVGLKMPLVLRDYQSYFEAKSRDLHIILTLKGWEISLISALAVYLLSNKLADFKSFSPLYIIIFMFWLLDCRTHVDIDRRHTDVVDKEQKLQETNLETFQQNIISWEFAEIKMKVENDLRNYRAVFKRTLSFFIKPCTFIWHIPLAIIISLFWNVPLAIILTLLLFCLIWFNLNNENTP
jgi:hypothetical protein